MYGDSAMMNDYDAAMTIHHDDELTSATKDDKSSLFQ